MSPFQSWMVDEPEVVVAASEATATSPCGSKVRVTPPVKSATKGRERTIEPVPVAEYLTMMVPSGTPVPRTV